jgi:hypothetical protein
MFPAARVRAADEVDGQAEVRCPSPMNVNWAIANSSALALIGAPPGSTDVRSREEVPGGRRAAVGRNADVQVSVPVEVLARSRSASPTR